MQPQIRYLKKADPIIAKVIGRIKLGKITQTTNRFQKLVRSIIGQQLSVKAAATIYNRFVTLFPKIKTGTFPTPQEVLKMPEAKLRSAGLSFQKISYIKDLALKIKGLEIDLENIHKLGDEEAIEALIKIKGIGRWTAEMFLIFSLSRPDVFSYGDLGLRNAIKNLYGLRKHPSPRKAREISDKWKPYRSLASRYLWASLDNE